MPDRALEVGATALDVSTGDDHAELCLRLARAAIIARRWKETEEYVGQAGRPDDARSSVLLAEAAHGAGRIDVAVEHANRAVERSEVDQHPEVLCEALCIVGRLARLSDPAAASAAFRRAGRVAAEFGLRPWRVEAELGLGTAEALDQEFSAKLVSARDLALDGGLLLQASGAEVILGEQAYVTNGPHGLEEPAQRVLDLGAVLHSPYLLGLGDLLLAQSNAVPGRERQMTAKLAAVEAHGGLPPDTFAQIWAVRALPRLLEPRSAGSVAVAGPLRRGFGGPRCGCSAAPVRALGAGPHHCRRERCRGPDQLCGQLPAGLRRANRGSTALCGCRRRRPPRPPGSRGGGIR